MIAETISPEVILFDLGGVLVELSGIPLMLEWCNGRYDEASLWRAWLASEAVRRFETGRNHAESFAREIIDEMQLTVDKNLFLEAFSDWPKSLYPGVSDFLKALRETHKIACFSNTNDLHWPRLADDMGLGTVFDQYFLSHKMGLLKPDQAAFQHVIDELGCDPGAILFLDDNQINVESALQSGMYALQARDFTAARTLVQAALI